MKLTVENMDNRQRKIYEELLKECKENKKGMRPKVYFLDLYTRGYFSQYGAVADLVFENL